jgi:O-antigen/teichoic acid export membrane protein
MAHLISGALGIAEMGKESQWRGNFAFSGIPWSRVRQITFSVADQGLSVGGMFLVNIALARTQTKEAYGVFTLLYTGLTFLTGLHNAAVLETFTVYGSGRYAQRFHQYAWLLWRVNAALGFGLTAILIFIWGGLRLGDRGLASRSFLGMALACGILLSASFVRRTFYMRRRPDLAARFSGIFFLVSVVLLWLSVRMGILDGFYAFVITAAGWVVAGLVFFAELPRNADGPSFSETEGNYWSEHWKYSRWVFVTALVFQFTTQGYYWLIAGFLSVKDVGNLRAMYNVVTPVDQFFVAIAFLVLPMMSYRYSILGMAGLIQLLKRYAFFCLSVTGTFAAAVRIFGRPVLHWLYHGRFDDVATLLGTFALVPMVMGVGNTVNAALKALEKPSSVFWAYVASGIATIIVGLPLVIYFGLRGAVYGLLVSAAVYSATLSVSFYSQSQVVMQGGPAVSSARGAARSLSQEVFDSVAGQK